MKILVASLGLVMLLLVHPALADAIGDADAAYIRKDFPEAARIYRALADSGIAKAQSQLAYLYYKGLGVPQSYVEAAKYLQLAANQGSDRAQSLLGVMYCMGRGIHEDKELCYMWSSIAARKGEPSAINVVKIVETQMTPVQLTRGNELITEWLAAHPKN